MTDLTPQQERIYIRLIDENKTAPDGHFCDDGISCPGIICSRCPLNDNNVTIGEVRKADPRNKPAATGASPSEDPSVKQPSHYQVFDGLESISVIARSMTVEQFKGFCLGNVLKYRLRAGKKSDQANIHKDLAKSEFYKELFEKHKGECYGEG